MNVVLVGEESAGIQALRMLASSGHRTVAVLASPGRPGASVWNAARAMGLPIWDAALVKDPTLADALRGEGVDLLLNVHSLFLIHPDVLSAPGLGSYNLHPGPLPRYAGLNAVSWALARGETDYGVTVHRMDPGIDTGPIAFQRRFPIGEEDTALSLYMKCIRDGVELLGALLASASGGGGAIPATPQILAERTYVSGGPPEDGRVRWSRPAREIANLVRACDYLPFPSPWGHPRAALAGHPVHLIKARRTGRVANTVPGAIGETAGGSALVACGDEWLQVDKVMVDERAAPAGEALQAAARLDDGTA